jgi:hypothetical protein
MLIGGLRIAHKIESRFVLHGVLIEIVANVLFVIYLLPWILHGQLPGEYWIELFESFAIKIAMDRRNKLPNCLRFRTP